MRSSEIGSAICGGLAAYMLADSTMVSSTVLLGPLSFMTVAAVLVFITGLLGFLAAWFENERMLNTFAVVLAIMCILQFTCVILVYVYYGQFVSCATSLIRDIINEPIQYQVALELSDIEFDLTDDFKRPIDLLQEKVGFKSWKECAIYFS
ncbi:unnamed protein product [Mesocestoides corti]|uniref:ABC transmembrane type-1 domain-containing protein n=1 Tax=Mesocestoides corti TaxID=53468 RepID=A0A0R3U7Z6_MESCO|nr:unnamed protein product [Mesocestoides corti]